MATPQPVTGPGAEPDPLPADAILLHLGFHKTGTTALQSAFAASRPELLEHGVLYPGRRRSHHPAAMAMTNRTWGVGREGGWDPDPRAWDRLARAAVRHPGRVLISSESFALTPDVAAARMVADLGPDRVHVAFTVRPMAALLSSSWQQYLKSGWTTTYEQWLEQVVAELEPGARRSGFWLRNDYPAIVGRWAALVGAERVHVVCLDGSDRGFLLRTFRELLDLPEGVPDARAADSNRSMTAAEAELLRSLNEVTTDWDWPTYQRTIRAGAAAGMVESRRPEPGEAPIVTPPDVLARVAAHGREVAAALAPLGVVVHGDLGVLGHEDGTGRASAGGNDGPSTPAGARTDLPIGAAVVSVLGAIRGAQQQAAAEVSAAQKAAAASAAERTGTPPSATTTRDLAAELTVRIRRGTRRRLTPSVAVACTSTARPARRLHRESPADPQPSVPGALCVIRFANVTKHYPTQMRPALDDVSLEVTKGEFAFLVGASGSGKSTFLRLVLREDRPTSGGVFVAGKDLSRMPNWKVPHLRRQIGAVFQDFRLLPNKTVYQNVAFALQVIGRPSAHIRKVVPEVIDLVGLAGKEGRYPDELSGGEQQRVAVARAFVNRPMILIADEPTGNLDPATSVGIMRLLDRINRTGTTVVMATHDAAVVDQMRKRVIELENGHVVRDQSRGVYGVAR